MEREIWSKWTQQKCWGSHFNIWQNSLHTKANHKRQRRTLPTQQGKIHQEDTASLNICTSNTTIYNFIKKCCYNLNHMSTLTHSGRLQYPYLTKRDRLSRQTVDREVFELTENNPATIQAQNQDARQLTSLPTSSMNFLSIWSDQICW